MRETQTLDPYVILADVKLSSFETNLIAQQPVTTTLRVSMKETLKNTLNKNTNNFYRDYEIRPDLSTLKQSKLESDQAFSLSKSAVIFTWRVFFQ